MYKDVHRMTVMQKKKKQKQNKHTLEETNVHVIMW